MTKKFMKLSQCRELNRIRSRSLWPTNMSFCVFCQHLKQGQHTFIRLTIMSLWETTPFFWYSLSMWNNYLVVGKVSVKKQDMIKNGPLVKNPQSWFYSNETWWKYLALSIWSNYLDSTWIVSGYFLDTIWIVSVNFWASKDFRYYLDSPWISSDP